MTLTEKEENAGNQISISDLYFIYLSANSSKLNQFNSLQYNPDF